ncbi:MAG: hypothetical protein KAQ83_02150 [Nanoarchaeota archaeon]|nr:hypothetical protein [Nanoarchaeota archaeon]
MKGKVKFDGKSCMIDINWGKLVEEPMKKGYFVEAFASADTILDAELHSMLRQIFNTHQSQTLINQLQTFRGDFNFCGSTILKILENLNLINKKLCNKVRHFKGQRNKVAHRMWGEYSLVSSIKFSNQEDWDNAVAKKAKKDLISAHQIFIELTDLNGNLCKKLDGFNSQEKASHLWELVIDRNKKD